MDIKKAIIPAAGLGTRFLPYTTAIPKEMLPVLNKPAIHYIALECMKAALKQMIFVTNNKKNAIADYFDTNSSLDLLIPESKHPLLLAELHKIISSINFTYVRQSNPFGLGHAVLTARHGIGKEYFCVLLPDDLIYADPGGIQQLMSIARQEKATIIAVQEVPLEAVSSYGVIGVKKQITPSLFQVGSLIEKPKMSDAPSNLAIVGRYVLSHKIFQALDEVYEANAEGELQLTSGLAQMLNNHERIFAYKIQGQRYDLGTPLNWLKGTIAMSLQDPLLARSVKQFLDELHDNSYSLPTISRTPKTTRMSSLL